MSSARAGMGAAVAAKATFAGVRDTFDIHPSRSRVQGMVNHSGS